ncbi:uncharacterized protein LOC144114774 [Amblyomma americanum]
MASGQYIGEEMGLLELSGKLLTTHRGDSDSDNAPEQWSVDKDDAEGLHRPLEDPEAAEEENPGGVLVGSGLEPLGNGASSEAVNIAHSGPTETCPEPPKCAGLMGLLALCVGASLGFVAVLIAFSAYVYQTRFSAKYSPAYP